MTRLKTTIALVALLVFPGVTSAQEAKLQLRYRFQPGQVLDFDVVQHTAIESTAQEVTSEPVVRNHSVRRWKVLEVDDQGVATIELSTLRVQMRSTEGGKTIEYDSADPAKQPEEFKKLAGVIGKPLTVLRVSPHGVVLDEKNVIEAEGIPAASAGQVLPILPDKPVAPGAKWRRNFEVTIPQVGKDYPLRRTYTLSTVKNGQALIKFDTIVLAPINSPGVEALLIQHCPAGLIQFDLRRGLILAQKQTLDKTVVGFLGPASSFKIKSTSTERLIDVATPDVARRNKPRR